MDLFAQLKHYGAVCVCFRNAEMHVREKVEKFTNLFYLRMHRFWANFLIDFYSQLEFDDACLALDKIRLSQS